MISESRKGVLGVCAQLLMHECCCVSAVASSDAALLLQPPACPESGRDARSRPWTPVRNGARNVLCSARVMCCNKGLSVRCNGGVVNRKEVVGSLIVWCNHFILLIRPAARLRSSGPWGSGCELRLGTGRLGVRGRSGDSCRLTGT